MSHYRAQLDYSDIHYMDECLKDLASLMYDIEILRCVGINKHVDYPGDAPEILRKSIFVSAELRIAPLSESPRNGGTLVMGDMDIRSPIQLRGGNPEEGDYGDKFNPDNVGDLIKIQAPLQGTWFVVGVPEEARLIAPGGAVFWRGFIRRIRSGSRGK